MQKQDILSGIFKVSSIINKKERKFEFTWEIDLVLPMRADFPIISSIIPILLKVTRVFY